MTNDQFWTLVKCTESADEQLDNHIPVTSDVRKTNGLPLNLNDTLTAFAELNVGQGCGL